MIECSYYVAKIIDIQYLSASLTISGTSNIDLSYPLSVALIIDRPSSFNVHTYLGKRPRHTGYNQENNAYHFKVFFKPFVGCIYPGRNINAFLNCNRSNWFSVFPLTL